MSFAILHNDNYKNLPPQIEYMRCIFVYGYRALLDEISSLINNSHSTKVTLAYWRGDMLEDDELKRVQKIATDIDTELEVLGSDYSE